VRPDASAQPPGPLRLRDALWLAALAATVAAAAHVAWYVARVFVFDTITGAARELPWWSPLSYLGSFLLLALPLLLLGAWVPILRSPRVLAAFFATIGSFAIALHLPAVHPAAMFALSLGVGVQAGRWLARDPVSGMRATRRVTLALGVGLFLAGIPGAIVYRIQASRAWAALPPPRPGAPNVILLILDTVRAANLSLYGYSRPTTPVLESLGTAGVVFESAIAPAPWTAPSHATMLTGQYPFFTGIGYRQPMDDSLRTISEVFQASGYATAAFMGNALYAGRTTGFTRGFGRFDDFPRSPWQALWSSTLPQMQVSNLIIDALRSREWWRLRAALPRAEFRINKVNQSDRYVASELVDNFLEWQDDTDGRPFFTVINFFDAHAPYESPLVERFNDGETPLDRYDGAIAYADSMIGRLLDGLRERGELEQTILLVTSDHGEQFGEHGLRGHGNSLYLELLHVPLLIHAPGRLPGGLRLEEVVSLRDIPATLLDLAGGDDPAIGGTSLAPLWHEGATASISPAIAEAVQPPNQDSDWPTSFGPIKAVITEQFHYIRRGDGLEQVWSRGGDTTRRGTATETVEGLRVVAESRPDER